MKINTFVLATCYCGYCNEDSDFECPACDGTGIALLPRQLTSSPETTASADQSGMFVRADVGIPDAKAA